MQTAGFYVMLKHGILNDAKHGFSLVQKHGILPVCDLTNMRAG